MKKDSTHCDEGHEMTEENTRWLASGSKLCKTCHRSYVAQRRRAQTEAQLDAIIEETRRDWMSRGWKGRS